MTISSNSRALVLILLLSLVKPSYEYVYSCDPTAACGCSSSPASMTRIVGGETVGTSAWGWAVSIYVGSDFQCGASILSSTWILSAAHCFPGVIASDITVFAGSNTLGLGQTRRVSGLTVHPLYNDDTFENDIALLQLSSPLNMSDPNVKPICLPSISAAVLAAGEWPPAGLYASDPILDHWKRTFAIVSLGGSGRMG